MRKAVPVETPNERVVRLHREILDGVTEVFEKKNKDYNGGVTLQSYFPFGLKSHAQMVHVKAQRVVSLAVQDKPPHHESVVDSLKDVINYATFAIMAIEEGWHDGL